MSYHWGVASAFLLGSSVLSGAVTVVVWRLRARLGTTSLPVMLIGATVWSGAYALEIASASLATAELWGAVKFVGIALWPAAYVVFVLRSTGRDHWVTPRLVRGLAVEPVVLWLLLAGPGTRELVRFYPPWDGAGPVPVALSGPLFWVHAAYTYALVIFATALFVAALVRLSRAYWGRSALLLSAVVLPLVANLLYVLALPPFEAVDPTPFAYVLAAGLFVWSGFRFGLLDVMPVARDAVMEVMADGVLVLDPLDRVVDLNPAARTLLGEAARSAVGRPAGRLLPGFTELAERLGPVGDGAGELDLGPDGPVVDLRASVLHDVRGRPTGRLVVLRDVTERKRAEEELSRLAHYDELTGLPNRKLVNDRLEQAVARCQRHGEPFALLFLDLDGFKLVNDHLGHDAGDALLRLVATRLVTHARAEDTVARLGGDEFMVLVSGVEAPHAVAAIAQRMLEDLHEPLEVAGQRVHASASIGIALCPVDGDDAATLVKYADVAMYRAKAQGRGRYEFFTREMSARAVRRFELERDLRRALDARELTVHYQPLVSASGDTAGVEALVRWDDPVRGRIPPDEFIGLAEETGLIGDLFERVLAAACRQASAWQAQFGSPSFVSVNVSPRQLVEPGLREAVEATLAEARLSPECLTLEITEGAIVGDRALARERLVELRALGVRVALDDFGAGHASLGHLKHLPVDELKIDRSFVAGLGHDPADEHIVAATISLAHALGLVVVAEGVESEHQRAELERLGCDFLQGYGLGAPMSVEDLTEFLAARAARGGGAPSRVSHRRA